MNFISIDRIQLRSRDFMVSSMTQRGVWVSLMIYCADMENGGRIAECGSWSDKVWSTLAGIGRKEVSKPSSLWTWDGQDLVVHFYPDSLQKRLETQRIVGKEAADRRWAAERARRSGNGSGNGSPIGEPSGLALGDPMRQVRRGEVRIGEEGTAPLSHSPSTAFQRRSRPRDLAEVLAKASMIGMPEDKARAWYADMEAAGWTNGRGELFGNWVREMTWQRDRVREAVKAPAPGGMPAGILLKRLEEEAKTHPGNPDSAGRRSDTPEDRVAYRSLKARIAELRTTVEA